MKKNRIVAILLLVFVLAVSVVLAACEMDNIDTPEHKCTSKCPDCGKCTNATCTEDACKDKCPGHHCKHVCPDCEGCLDDTCENPICKNNRCVCESLIDSAKNYIDGIYKELEKTDRDFELITSAYIKKTDVTIKWSVKVEEGKTAPVIIKEVDGKTMAVISSEESEVERPYTLVGEITAGTDKATVEYQLVVPIVDVMRNNFYKNVATSVSEGKDYYIGMYQKNVKKVLYFAGEMSSRWFGTTQDMDASTVVKLVKDGEGYRIQFVAKDGKTKYIEIVTYDDKGSTKVGMYEDGDSEVKPGKCIWKFDKTTLTLTTKVGTATYFLGAYQTNETIGRSDADQYLKASNIDVSQFPIRLIEKKADVDRNDQEKAQYEVDKLSFVEEIKEAGEVALNTAGTKYTDVAISWTSDNETIAKVEGGKVTFTLPEAQTTVKLTATATINGKTATKVFSVVVKPQNNVGKDFLASIVADVEMGKEYYLGLWQANVNKVLYFKGEMSGYYLGTVEDMETSVPVKLVAAEGNAFYITFVDVKGATKYIDAKQSESNGKTFNNILISDAKGATFSWNADIKGFVTKLGDTEFYIGTFGTNVTYSLSKLSYVTGDNATSVDKTNFVVHAVAKAGGAEPTPATDAEKVAKAKAALEGKTVELKDTAEVALPTYTGATLVWKLANGETAVKLSTDGLKIAALSIPTDADKTVTITVDITIGEAKDTATVEVIIKKEVQIEKLTIAEFLKKADKSNSYSVTGIVTGLDSKAVFIQDATGAALYVYDKGDHAEGVAIGKKVTYTGTYDEYNGLKQMASPKLAKEVEDTEEKITATVLDEAAVKALTAADASKLVTLNGVKYDSGSAMVDKGGTYKFTIGETTISVRVEKNGDSKAIIELLGKLKKGDEINLVNVNVGWFKALQFALTNSNCVKAVELTPSQKLEAEKTALTAPVTTITATGDTTLATAGKTYTDVTISWKLENGYEGIAVVENVLKVTALPTEQKTVKLVATLSIAGATEPITAQKEFEVTVNPATVSAQDKIDAVMAELAKVPGFADIKAAGTIGLEPVKGTAYEEVVITWTLKTAFDGITVENNTIKVAKLPETAGTITLVATLTIGNETVQNNTKEYTVNVAAAPVVEDGGSLENPKTVAEALASGIKAGEYSKAVWYVKGYIVGTPSYNTTYKNYTVLIADEKGGATTFKIYGLKLDGNAQGIYENDEIVASGYIQHFVSGNNSELELTFIKDTRDCLLEKYTPGKSKITVVANENADIAIEGNLTEVDNGTEITITVTAHTGYQISSVNVNDKPITAEADGTYKVTVGVPTTIRVETAVEGSAIQQSVVKLTFPDDNKANNTVSAYTETWTAKKGDFSWTISNFNNNQWKDNWAFIRCGSKKAASVGTIATSAAMVDAIDKVVVTIDRITAASVNSIKLIVAKDANYTEDVKTITLEKLEKGDAVFNISEAYANCYIKLEIDCAKGSGNGFVQISAIEYFATK